MHSQVGTREAGALPEMAAKRTTLISGPTDASLSVQRRLDCECNGCQNILAELEAALSEIRASPRVSKQLRHNAGLLLRIGTGGGAEEAIGHNLVFSG